MIIELISNLTTHQINANIEKINATNKSRRFYNSKPSIKLESNLFEIVYYPTQQRDSIQTCFIGELIESEDEVNLRLLGELKLSNRSIVVNLFFSVITLALVISSFYSDPSLGVLTLVISLIFLASGRSSYNFQKKQVLHIILEIFQTNTYTVR